jgi:plastocyanin
MRAILLGSAVATLVAASALSAQSLLYRSPNLSGTWVPDPGVVQFNFLHRFNVSPAPARAVTNFPTFTLATGIGGNLGVGYRFATRELAGPGSTSNESELFARWRFLGAREGSEGFAAAVTPAYNFRMRSVDGELSADYTTGPVTLLAAVRELSKPFGQSRVQTALGGGAVIRLNQYIAVSGDYAKLLGGDTTAAWSAGIQVQIPGSPHTFALEVSNVAANTYQGSSRGGTPVSPRLYGFEFTIPLHLSRFGAWFHPGSGLATGVTGPAAATVDVVSLHFAIDTVRIAAGQVVRWVNEDPLDHSVTFEVEGPASGPIPAKGSYAVRFDSAGIYPYHCTPHPFMRGVVVVR